MRFTTRMIAALAAVWLWIGQVAAQVPCRYEVTFWPNMDCGFGPFPGTPVAVNDSGHVTGWFIWCGEPNFRSFLWTGGPTTQVLPLPAGYAGMQVEAMNNAGEIVGQLHVTNGGQPRAFFRQANGTVVPLTFPPDVNASWATSINNNSEVAGYCNTPVGYRPFVWKDGKLTLINVPSGSEWVAFDINDDGKLALWQWGSQGFVWFKGNAQSIGLLPGGTSSPPRSIANNGHVTGRGNIPDNDSATGFVFRAYLFDGQRLLNLGTLPGTIDSSSRGINDHVIVGGCSDVTGGIAFDFVSGMMRRLDALQPNQNLTLYLAGGISESGLVAANGRIGDQHYGVLLTPVFAPVADVDANCSVGVPDLLALISAWGSCDPQWFCPTDLNGDGIVNKLDLLIVIQHWGEQS